MADAYQRDQRPTAFRVYKGDERGESEGGECTQSQAPGTHLLLNCC